MSENEIKRNLFILGQNGSGVKLANFELEMLAFLAKQKILTSRQLHLYYSHYHNLSSSSFRGKLWRWNNKDVIETKNITAKQRWGNEYNIVRIGKKGVKILIEEGYLSPQWENINIRQFFSIKNYDHYIATQEVVLQTLLHSKGIFLDRKNIISLPTDKYSHIIENRKMRILPDWILQKDKNFLMIELDTGNEPTSTLLEKVKKYIEVAQGMSNKNITVLITLLDDSMPTQRIYNNNGVKRLANMKKVFLYLRNLHMPNFKLYVSFLKDAAEIGYYALYGNIPIHELELDAARYALHEIHPLFEYTFKEVANSDIYFNKVPKEFYADVIYELINKKNNSFETVLFVFIERNNIQILDRIKYLSDAIQNQRFKRKVSKIVGFCIRESDRDEIVGAKIPHLLLGDFDTWVRDLNLPPKFFKTRTPYSLEEVEFEE
ncbi:replication-relaxation family protein [Halobacillus salinarum]|uniref:Replication-relaxation family protein n=1 Tax=Halobacillus salinarum TaxID=2932257 RepID=A0ABY4EH17_9BACI|nr:replication-relaxation family protein [Halobacillus salinarum]UOQ43761.1 replication-relaxation family protein [Halobacillus salinarum]